MAEALYRKYRPQVFADVVGQEHIERTLKNAIDGDRVSHAYLFTGPRGTGKTTTARLLAKALICENGPTSNPCGACEDCQLIAAGAHPDVYELDAASRTGVDNVREEIIGRVQYAPVRGRSKIYIVDEVHMLSTQAFNALLKTLEEPPSHVVFILCTTDPQKVPETIRSRCQRFDFRRISPENIISRLGAICVSEGVEFEGEALDLIAQRCDGGMRDALTSLEQLITYGAGTVTLTEAERLLGSLDVDDMAEIVEAIGRRDVAAGFRWTSRYVETGADLAQFTQDLVERMRNLYVYSILGPDACVSVGEVERRQIVQELPLFGQDRLAYILGVLGDMQKELKASTNARLTFEIALTRMARPAGDLTLEALAARIEALEASGMAASVASAMHGAASEGAVCQVQGADAGMGAQCGGSGQGQFAVSSQGACVGHGPGILAGECELPQEHRVTPFSSDLRAEGAEIGVNPAAQQPATAQQAAPTAAQQPAAAQQPTDVQRAVSPTVDVTNNPALQRAWQQVMAAVKKEKMAYGVLFLNTKVRECAGRLNIEFAAESDFAFQAVQKPDVDEVLSRAIRQVFAADVPYAYVQASAAARAVAPTAAAQPAMQSVCATAGSPMSQAAGGASSQGAMVSTANRRVAPEAVSAMPVQAGPVAVARPAEAPAVTAAASQPASVPAYEEPPYEPWAPVDDEPPYEPWVPDDGDDDPWSLAPTASHDDARFADAAPAEVAPAGVASADVAPATGVAPAAGVSPDVFPAEPPRDADEDKAALQDALSFFGAVTIEEIK